MSNEQPVEIERKFLVGAMLFELEAYPCFSIDQGYHSSLRFRKKDDKFFQTEKKGKGLVRIEREHEISSDEFNDNWPRTAGCRLSKKRYEIAYGKYICELDVYEGELDSLMTVEVEFDSVEEANAFIPPDWFDRELTDDERYTNYNLCLHGLPN